eukprot:UN04379
MVYIIEKVPTTDAWLWLVFSSCVAVFITTPIFLYILICVARKNRDASPWILCTTFGYLICLFSYALSQFLIFNPSQWNIQPSTIMCNCIKRPEIVFIALARFCFYQFNLFRINVIFESIPKLKLPRYQFIAMEILICGYLLYHGIIFNLITDMNVHPKYGFCFASQTNSDIHIAIIRFWDAFIIIILVSMFATKLIYGAAQEDITFQRFII